MDTFDFDLDAVINAAVLPHLPRQLIRECYARAPGDELRSKFSSVESSAALAANAFGMFLEQPGLLEGLPGGTPVTVRLEYEVRFPWAGGRHPWLDVLVETADTVVGIESKRYEPFRGCKPAEFSPAFDRSVWGEAMNGYQRVRDILKKDARSFAHLDGAQLVKHALGLRTRVQTRAKYPGKRPVLFYLYAEPTNWADGRPVDNETRIHHRSEIERFAAAVAGCEVEFHHLSYTALIDCWSRSANSHLASHARAIRKHFRL